MPFMVARRRLEPGDFDAWESRFRAGSGERKAAGCRGVRRFRGTQDENELMIIFDWETIAHARAFVAGKEAQVPQLLELREDGTPKHSYFFVDELPPLES